MINRRKNRRRDNRFICALIVVICLFCGNSVTAEAQDANCVYTFKADSPWEVLYKMDKKNFGHDLNHKAIFRNKIRREHLSEELQRIFVSDTIYVMHAFHYVEGEYWDIVWSASDSIQYVSRRRNGMIYVTKYDDQEDYEVISDFNPNSSFLQYNHNILYDANDCIQYVTLYRIYRKSANIYEATIEHPRYDPLYDRLVVRDNSHPQCSIEGHVTIINNGDTITPGHEEVTLSLNRQYTFTDKKGNYSFHDMNIAPGTYTIKVRNPEYRGKTVTVNVDSVKTIFNIEVFIDGRDFIKQAVKELEGSTPVIYDEISDNIKLANSINETFKTRFNTSYQVVDRYHYLSTAPPKDVLAAKNIAVFMYLTERYGNQWEQYVNEDLSGFKTFKAIQSGQIKY